MKEEELTKKAEKYADEVITPILKIIDEQFFTCICMGNDLPQPIAIREDEYNLFKQMAKDISNQASIIESGSIIYDAQGINGIALAKKMQDSALIINVLLKLIETRNQQIFNALEFEKQRKKNTFTVRVLKRGN